MFSLIHTRNGAFSKRGFSNGATFKTGLSFQWFSHKRESRHLFNMRKKAKSFKWFWSEKNDINFNHLGLKEGMFFPLTWYGAVCF